MAPQSIFLRDYRVMAPAQLVHYPHGVSTLLPIIEACDNTSLPVGPFSATWKTLRDEHNSKYKKAPDSLTPLDQLVPFFIAAPEASPEQYTQPQPIGFVRPDVLQAMRDYSTEQASQPIFNFLGGIEAPWGVSFADWLNAPRGPVTPFELRTQEMTRMVESWREKDMFPENLRGWRNERYSVYGPPGKDYYQGSNISFYLERAATALFGMATFGVHLTGYYRDERTYEYFLWISRRSKTKQTWPDCFDNTVAGGITEADAPLDSMIRECGEEASLPAVYVQKNLSSTGLISYVRKDKDNWLFPEIEYSYDLTFAANQSVTPKPNDDEVDHFQCLSANQVIAEMVNGQFKPNCALIIIDFFIRHGLITPEVDSRYNEICRRLRREIAMPGPA